MRRLFRVHRDLLGNFPGLPAIFPASMAPVAHTTLDRERERSFMRWGFPPPPNLGDAPVTDVRNLKSPYWRGWLRQEWRCLVLATSFCEWRVGVPVSVVGTLYGTIGTSGNPLAQGGLKQIYSYADDVVVTYYPINPDYTVKSPTVISNDIGALVNLYPASLIYFNEIGFPSGSGGYTKKVPPRFSSNLCSRFFKPGTDMPHTSRSP